MFLEAFLVRLIPIRDHSLKYLVYRDLWLRGKYVSSDDRYGAEFLVYPGDPLYSHSSHAITLTDSQKIRPIDFISIARTCTEVNKYCVFAYSLNTTNKTDNTSQSRATDYDDNVDYPKVHYQTIEWVPNNIFSLE